MPTRPDYSSHPGLRKAAASGPRVPWPLETGVPQNQRNKGKQKSAPRILTVHLGKQIDKQIKKVSFRD